MANEVNHDVEVRGVNYVYKAHHKADIAEAMVRYGVTGVTAPGLALHTQAVLQGAFILAKAKGDATVARESVVHLKRYFEFLFKRT